MTKEVATLVWIGDTDGSLRILDQTRLPREVVFRECHDERAVWEAIKTLQVRGAPAIGIAAAYGVCLGMKFASNDERAFFQRLDEVTSYLASSRPTAVNLFWALDRMRRRAEALRGQPPDTIRKALLEEARAIHEEDRALCHAIGRWGERLIEDGSGVLVAWPPQNMVQLWLSSTRRLPRENASMSTPTKPVRSSRGHGLPPGSSKHTASLSP